MRNNPKKAEEMYSDTWSSCMSYSDFLFNQNEDLRKQIKRLQKQLDEANEVIKYYSNFAHMEIVGKAFDYIKKWGVK